MKRVIVTGATGFIGRHSIMPLLERGYEVHAVSSSPQTPSPFLDIHQHQCDLLDPIQTQNLIQKVSPTHLLHFAWYVAPGRYWTSPMNLNWVQASLNLLQVFHKYGGQRVVMAGTCAEYDWSQQICHGICQGVCHEEKTPLNPSTLYGACKAALYQIMQAYTKEVGLSSAWGRIFMLYGPHEYPTRLVPGIIQSLMRQEVAKCTHGKQRRDFMHVSDVANAFVTLLDSTLEGAINIASGESVTLKTVIEKIASKFQLPDHIHYGAINSPPNDPEQIIADISRLKNELKWTPQKSLDIGLDETIDWWKQTDS